MHKDFYASGFLYHPRTQQILLQKETSKEDAPWTLVTGKSVKNETDKEAFKRLIDTFYDVEIDLKSIFPVYSYFHDDFKKENFVSYAKINKLASFNSKKVDFKWFSFREVLKIKVSEQTRQDITVIQRVIASSTRKRLGQQTIG